MQTQQTQNSFTGPKVTGTFKNGPQVNSQTNMLVKQCSIAPTFSLPARCSYGTNHDLSISQAMRCVRKAKSSLLSNLLWLNYLLKEKSLHGTPWI